MERGAMGGADEGGRPPDGLGSAGRLAADAPEHDWEAAARLLYPSLQPVGTHGTPVQELGGDRALVMDVAKSHTMPIIAPGPCDLAIAYVLHADGFDVVVNREHLLSWAVQPSDVHEAAMRNLAAWSGAAGWTDETSGERRILSSETGDGWDAARILLPEVRGHLAAELGTEGRVLVGLPERHLLVAASLRPGDEELAALLADFLREQSDAAEEPIDDRVLELLDAEIVVFSPLPAAS